MRCRDAVARGADDRQIRHPHLSRLAFLDQTHSLQSAFVARIAGAHNVEEPAIDFVNDLQMPRQNRLEQPDRASFKRLGQQRVICICQRANQEIPRLLPVYAHIVEAESASTRPRQARDAAVT